MTIDPKLVKFRNIMAEQGKEFTLEQAKEIYDAARKLIKNSKKISQASLWKIQEIDIEGMTEQEKHDAIMLYQHIRDL